MRTLLCNFAQLTREWRERNPVGRSVPYRSRRTSAVTPENKKTHTVRVLVAQRAASISAEQIFHGLYGSSRHACWLDSSQQGGELGRFSFLGDPSGPLARIAYELKAECGGRLVHRSENPDAAMIFADRAVAVDHFTATVYLLAMTNPGDEASARSWLEHTSSRLNTLASALWERQRPAQPLGDLGLRHHRSQYLKLIEGVTRRSRPVRLTRCA